MTPLLFAICGEYRNYRQHIFHKDNGIRLKQHQRQQKIHLERKVILGTNKILQWPYLSNSINAKEASVFIVGIESHHAFSYFINSNPLCKLRAVQRLSKLMNGGAYRRNLSWKIFRLSIKAMTKLTPCAFHLPHFYSMNPALTAWPSKQWNLDLSMMLHWKQPQIVPEEYHHQSS